MVDLNVALAAAAILLPVLGAIVAPLFRRPRTIAIAAAAAALVATAAAAIPVLSHTGLNAAIRFDAPGAVPVAVDPLSAVPMVLFSGLVLCVLVAAPRKLFHARGCSGVLILLASSLAAYAAMSPFVFFAAWTASVIPFLLGMWQMPENRRQGRRRFLPAVAMVCSCLFLGAGLALNELAPSAEVWVFALLILAALVRKGVFPFQTWVIEAFSEGPLLPFGLLMNAHFGALLIARIAIPVFPELSRSACLSAPLEA